MNKELYDKVMPIAKRVREWAQAKADATKYNPHNLCGWCAISAAHLFRELKRENIDAEIHYVSCHCFVVVDDHVVDVTATQFNEFRYDKILILHIKEAGQYSYYETEKVFNYPNDLREYQIKKNWPRKEICYTR